MILSHRHFGPARHIQVECAANTSKCCILMTPCDGCNLQHSGQTFWERIIGAPSVWPPSSCAPRVPTHRCVIRSPCPAFSSPVCSSQREIARLSIQRCSRVRASCETSTSPRPSTRPHSLNYHISHLALDYGLASHEISQYNTIFPPSPPTCVGIAPARPLTQPRPAFLSVDNLVVHRSQSLYLHTLRQPIVFLSSFFLSLPIFGDTHIFFTTLFLSAN